MIKPPRKGRWIASTAKTITRMYFEDLKRVMERHELGISTLATLLVVVLLLVSCGAVGNAPGSNGSLPPSGNGTNLTGHHVHMVGPITLLPLAQKVAGCMRRQTLG